MAMLLLIWLVQEAGIGIGNDNRGVPENIFRDFLLAHLKLLIIHFYSISDRFLNNLRINSFKILNLLPFEIYYVFFFRVEAIESNFLGNITHFL